MNAIFVFVASGFVARLLTVVRVGDTTVKGWVYQNLCVEPLSAIGLGDVRLHSLAYAVGFVACWWLVLWAMWRRGWRLKTRPLALRGSASTKPPHRRKWLSGLDAPVLRRISDLQPGWVADAVSFV